MSTLDRVIRFVWTVGVVTVMVLLYLATQFPIALRVAFVLGWTLLAMVFSRRRALFPDINSYSAEMQDAMTFFGWFVIILLGAGAVALWLFSPN